MKAFTVNGITKSGKTTTIEQIIRELKKRGYSVGSVKEIHYEKFKIDTEGTNTDRHKKAGSEIVSARGMFETDILYQEMLPIYKLLSFYDHDYVVLEGVNDVNAPKIITAHDVQGIELKMDYKAFMISGVIAEGMTEYKGFPVINCLTEIEKLVDMIEEKVPELMPDFDADCCTECGLDCHTMLTKILSGEKEREDCVVDKGNIKLVINGKDVKMVPFVKNILTNAVMGVLKELQGYEKGADIKISIGDSYEDR